MENTKHALVTGGTSGVGLSIVNQLVKHNFKVTFIGSNSSKGKRVELEINNSSNSLTKGLKHKFVQLDLSDLSLVKEFSNQFKQENKSLNLLVNVAGIMSPKQQLTASGLDKTFAIGYLSTFILSTELIPLLEKVENSRIVNVGGGFNIINKAKLEFDNLNFTNRYSGLKTAFATIHAKSVLTQILAEKLIPKNIDVNSFHPGTVKSNLTRNMSKVLQFLAKMASVFMAKESSNGIFVCLDKSITGQTGKLFVKQKPIDLKFGLEYSDELWKITKKIVSEY